MKPASIAIRQNDKIITLLTEIRDVIRGWKHGEVQIYQEEKGGPGKG